MYYNRFISNTRNAILDTGQIALTGASINGLNENIEIKRGEDLNVDLIIEKVKDIDSFYIFTFYSINIRYYCYFPL